MISIIIPTYNEAEHIKTTVQLLLENDTEKLIGEVIVCDGGSTDNTSEVASDINGIRFIKSPAKGRSAQMNYGAMQASSELLYFLHADTLPPNGFTSDIKKAIDNGFEAGCFILQFDYDHWFLKANCWFTRFDVNLIRFGDQSLFVTKKLFEKAGGFNEQLIVMEDQEIIKRIKTLGTFTVIRKPVITSARKYLVNGIFRTQGIFFLIYLMYYLGYSQQQLVAAYKKRIVQDKL